MSRGNLAGMSMRESVRRTAGVGWSNVRKTGKQLHSSAEGGTGGTLGTNGTVPR
jgi:hypothetical protein